MSDVTTPDRTGRPARQARIMRAVNVPMRVILGLPFPTPLSRNLMLLRYTGRRTGRAYRQPLSYARDGAALLTPGGGKWTLSLGDGKPVRLRLRGNNVTARPELVADPAEVDRLFGVIAQGNPRAARFVPIPRDADGHFAAEPLALAIRHGFCIVRWHLDD
ncbi:MAG: hypothetical protein JWM19_479 [Actinomycetia bacterium]|nr:hypothetical protein [Actinomycetes bacterium]